MKSFYCLLTLSALSTPSIALGNNDNPQNKGWGYSLGIGTVFSPTYLGDDEGQVSTFPNIRITYGDSFFASLGEGIGINLNLSKHWRIGPVIKYDFGRDEEGSSPLTFNNDNTDLVGLGDIEGTVEVGGFIESTFKSISAKLEARQGIDGHESMIGEASISYQGIGRIGSQTILYTFGPEVKFLSQDYAKTYFDITAQQSIASGLTEHTIEDDALIYALKANVIVPHSQHIASVLFASVAELDDTLGESSLVLERGDQSQTTIGYFINYSF